MREEIILKKGRSNALNCTRFIANLPTDKAFLVEIRDHKPRRTSEQNRYLWACYRTLLDKGGETLGGWTAEDLHEFFLGEAFGVETLMIGVKRYERPLRRSSRLTKQEFSDLLAVVRKRADKMGIYIPEPEEYLAS